MSNGFFEIFWDGETWVKKQQAKHFSQTIKNIHWKILRIEFDFSMLARMLKYYLYNNSQIWFILILFFVVAKNAIIILWIKLLTTHNIKTDNSPKGSCFKSRLLYKTNIFNMVDFRILLIRLEAIRYDQVFHGSNINTTSSLRLKAHSIRQYSNTRKVQHKILLNYIIMGMYLSIKP